MWRFLWEYNTTVLRWARWARAEVEAWPDDLSELDVTAGFGRIVSAASRPGPIRKPGDPAVGPVTYPSRRSCAAGAGTWEGFHMSVLVIGKFKGDTAKFQQALADRADEFAKISEESKAVGGVHHRFGIGDGYVLIVDEWESVEQFQKFMANPDLQAFIGSVGGAPEPPEVIVAEAISSPDEF